MVVSSISPAVSQSGHDGAMGWWTQRWFSSLDDEQRRLGGGQTVHRPSSLPSTAQPSLSTAPVAPHPRPVPSAAQRQFPPDSTLH